jgi:hypothetical protein
MPPDADLGPRTLQGLGDERLHRRTGHGAGRSSDEGPDTSTGGSGDDVDGYRGRILGLILTVAPHRILTHGAIIADCS